MIDKKKLLLSPLETGHFQRAHFVIIKGRTIISEGECALSDIPQVACMRVAFLGRSAYFDALVTEVKSRKMRPFLARRHLDNALAFNEPFRLRFSAELVGDERQRLSLSAVSEADIAAASQHLPLHSRTCEHLSLVESAIAAFVALETSEAVSVLWQRGSALLGLIVQNGIVQYRLLETRLANARPNDTSATAANTELRDAHAERLARLRASLNSAAQRIIPNQEIRFHLQLGELAGTSAPRIANAAPASATLAALKSLESPESLESLESRLARRFTACQPNAPLQWPEVYGLQYVSNDTNLLESDYQQHIWAQKAALILGGLLTAGAVASTALALTQYAEWQSISTALEERRVRVEADYAAINPRRPSSSQLNALEQRMKIESGASDFRVDALLAWISDIAPRGATIRSLEIGHAAASSASPASTANNDAQAGLRVHVEWELQGDYPKVEELAAQLTRSLVERTRLANSKLEYMPTSPSQAMPAQARLTTVLTPLPGRFRQ